MRRKPKQPSLTQQIKDAHTKIDQLYKLIEELRNQPRTVENHYHTHLPTNPEIQPYNPFPTYPTYPTCQNAPNNPIQPMCINRVNQ